MSRVYVLLPPSETKEPGGSGPALDLSRLSHPGLTSVRSQLLAVAAAVSSDLPAARAAFKVSAGLDDEIAHNTRLLTAPTMPALYRYSGVLYAALHSPKLTKAESSRAAGRILITSALFGLVRGTDLIPAYRLSAGSRLPGLPTPAALWRPALTQVLAALDEPLLDLRSGAYAAFAPAPNAISVRVVAAGGAGNQKSVSHDNKVIKGALARVVATSRAGIDTPGKLIALARRAGLTVQRTGASAIELIAPK